MDKIEKLENILEYKFYDQQLLKQALCHRSLGSCNNERLEFLGDATLSLVIGQELFHRFTEANEGILTRMRAQLVSGTTLAAVAKELRIGDFVLLGAGEKKSGGHQRTSILENTLEAIIGAILLDSDLLAVQQCILRWFASRLTAVKVVKHQQKDPKTRLQELLQAQHLALPNYSIFKVTGDSNEHVFCVHCCITLLPEPISGVGSTRRMAEQQAALKALELLEK